MVVVNFSESKVRPTKDPIRNYLIRIGKIPLLSKQEELRLGTQIQAAITIQSQMGDLSFEDFAKQNNISAAELRDCIARGKRAKKKMIEANLRLVVSIAKSYQKRGLDLEELIQEGCIGLQRAAERFDPNRGYKFSTYATWWIRQAITRAVATSARTIRLPIHLTEKLNKLKKASQALSQQLKKTPTIREIAAWLNQEYPDDNFSEDKIRELYKQSAKPTSLNRIVGKGEDIELLMMIPSEDEEYSDAYELITALIEDSDNLTPFEKEVLIENRLKGRTLADIGREKKLCRERIRQVEVKAMNKFKRRIKGQEANLVAIIH